MYLEYFIEHNIFSSLKNPKRGWKIEYFFYSRPSLSFWMNCLYFDRYPKQSTTCTFSVCCCKPSADYKIVFKECEIVVADNKSAEHQRAIKSLWRKWINSQDFQRFKWKTCCCSINKCLTHEQHNLYCCCCLVQTNKLWNYYTTQYIIIYPYIHCSRLPYLYVQFYLLCFYLFRFN